MSRATLQFLVLSILLFQVVLLVSSPKESVSMEDLFEASIGLTSSGAPTPSSLLMHQVEKFSHHMRSINLNNARFSRFTTWPKLVVEEALQAKQTRHQSTMAGPIIAKWYLDLLKDGLLKEASEGLLSSSDYEILIFAGLSDIAVEISKVKGAPEFDLLKLVTFAANLGEEAFVLEVFNERSNLPSFTSVAADPDFWVQICLVECFEHFDEAFKYLEPVVSLKKLAKKLQELILKQNDYTNRASRCLDQMNYTTADNHNH